MNPDLIIETRHLSKSYGAFKAVDDLNFEVHRGDVFGFLGPNGSGKSTTIRMLLSLIRPDSGEIRIFNKPLYQHRNEILAQIGSIVEKPDFYKYLSAEKNLELFARLSGIQASKSKLYEVLELVGLKGREKDKAGAYSHGMRQRLGLAQTLIHDPQLIILDEPTTGLDPQGIIDIRNLINHLREDKGKTILLSSHILSEIEMIATRMVIINKGKAIAQGAVSDLLHAEDMIVSFGVRQAAQCTALLDSSHWHKNVLQHDGNTFVFQLSQQEIGALNRFLVENGLEIFAIESKRKLEDYFLKLVAETA